MRKKWMLELPPALNPVTKALVITFAEDLARKLRKAEEDYGYTDDWLIADPNELRRELKEHLKKGDPRDVAAYCAFLWHKGEGTK